MVNNTTLHNLVVCKLDGKYDISKKFPNTYISTTNILQNNSKHPVINSTTALTYHTQKLKL